MGHAAALGALAAHRRSGLASGGADRLVDGQHDVRYADCLRRPGQQVAAAGPTHGAHQAATAQFCEQLFQVGQRDVLARGDFRQRHRGAVAVAGKVGHRHHRVSALGGQFHFGLP